eukprot:189803-Pyramimonas_sp.AAC.1
MAPRLQRRLGRDSAKAPSRERVCSTSVTVSSWKFICLGAPSTQGAEGTSQLASTSQSSSSRTVSRLSGP